jgi:hypothetical protein
MLGLLKQRINTSEKHFLDGLEMLKGIANNTQDSIIQEQLNKVIDELEKSETPYDEVMQYLRVVEKRSVDNDPSFTATSVVELPIEDRGLERSIVRMNTSRIDQARQDKDAFFRRQPVKLTNPLTGQFIVRMPMGGGGVKGLTKDSIALDYDAIDTLGIRSKFIDGKLEATVLVSKASTLSVYRYYWGHPDVGYRLAMRLSMVGLVLGILGFLPLIFDLVKPYLFVW